MSKGINTLDNTVLQEFLGADSIEELRTKVIDMIVEEIRDQLHQSSSYIISPDDIAIAAFQTAMEEIVDEIKEEYKQKISEAVQKKLGNLDL